MMEVSTFKEPATGSRGMVCTNHPVASAAGAEMLALGGNAIDAAVASLFALSVVEPMMVGILGGGIANLRLADGTVCSIDNYSTSPGASTDTLYTPLVVPTPPRADPDYLKTVDDASAVGLLAVGVPGTLKAWCHILHEFGSGLLSLATIMDPAIRRAEHGFPASEYLVNIIQAKQASLATFPATAAVFLPGGSVPKRGELIIQRDLAESYRTIAAEGPDALYGGRLGVAMAAYMRREGGLITLEDLRQYSIRQRYLGPWQDCPTRGTYRGYHIIGATPCSAGGVHLIEILNILELYELGQMGFGSVEACHLLLEAIKLGFEDRNASTGDPEFLDVPVAKLISKEWAQERAKLIRADGQARPYGSGGGGGAAGAEQAESSESSYTTNLCVADAEGNIVEMTQTINDLFGSGAMVPGTGLLLNNTQSMASPSTRHLVSSAPLRSCAL